MSLVFSLIIDQKIAKTRNTAVIDDEFEGHPLRKDYPVDKRQPLIGPVN